VPADDVGRRDGGEEVTYCPLIKQECNKDKCEWYVKGAVRCAVPLAAEIVWDGTQLIEVVRGG